MISRLLSRYWLLVPILIIVVIIVDRIETPSTIETEDTIQMSETRSDYYMSDFQSRKFSASGDIEFTVKGETLAHYPDTDSSEIAAPRIQLHRLDTVWHIQSQTGRFDTNPDLFTLQGQVIIKRQQPGTQPVTITTNSLTVAPQSNEVATEEPVEIVAPTWRLQATGLTSAIDDGRLNLLSQVTGRYEVTDAP